ncbi:hypothetical protein B296_00054756 [Ensete ventricosum]|uniref:Uncharacterized protein n=1 Tax=Ensete ventricosum TaxID=4639 RepID=A0A426WWR2_ENSVE|nr:hypothetical protein B296_00054756 [Ensete ventricosum]
MGSTSTISRKNTTVINFAQSPTQVEFHSIFHSSSRNFKILAIPNVLAHGKSYKHDFAKKYNGHKLYAKSRFDRFFVHLLGISKYWSFLMY